MVTDDLTIAFSDVAQQLDPDVTAMIDGAIQRGRRIKTRRRIAIAISAGATVLAIAVGTTFGAQLAGWSAQGPKPTSHRSHRTTVLRPHHSRRHRSTVARIPQEHGPGMTSNEMLAVLRTMLPPGEVTYVDPTWGRGDLEFNFDDGKGAVDIQLSVKPTTDAVGSDPLACLNIPAKDEEGKMPAGAPPISCTTVTLHNGDIIRKDVTGADFAGYYNIQLYMTRPDGVDVSIAVANGTLEGTPHQGKQGWPWADRAVPPGSLAFWQRVILSPKWHL